MFSFVSLSSVAPKQPQPQVSDRHQIDDMTSNSTRTSMTTNSPAAASRHSTTSDTTDGLGPLPPGWQMSKTDSDRVFFIDHIGKRTTWVKSPIAIYITFTCRLYYLD